MVGCPSEQDAAVVFKNAADLKATGEGFAWLVTEQTLTGKARGGLPQGWSTMLLNYGIESRLSQDFSSLIKGRATWHFSLPNTTFSMVLHSCNSVYVQFEDSSQGQSNVNNCITMEVGCQETWLAIPMYCPSHETPLWESGYPSH